MNNSSASRRLRRGASSVPVATFGSLRMEGRKNHTIAPHTTKATAALRYITVKPKPIAGCVGERGPITHASDTCARSIELEHHRFPPGAVGMLAGKGEHLRVGGRAEAAQEHPNKQQNEIVAVPGNNTQAKTPSRQQKQSGFLRSPFLSERPARNWLTRMPMMALPVKKKPTIAGRAWTSLVRNRLSVGVCNAPAIPVRKATIKTPLTSNQRALVRRQRGCYACSVFASNRERRSLRRLSLNKQRAKSRLPQ